MTPNARKSAPATAFSICCCAAISASPTAARWNGRSRTFSSAASSRACAARLDEIHAGLRASRLFVALHMHAGDGNVHTNIPVFSNDYAMLQEAHRIVDRVMRLAVSLGGVISGEHGIGLTKLHYLDAPETRGVRALQAATSTPTAISIAASCCRARPSTARTRRRCAWWSRRR